MQRLRDERGLLFLPTPNHIAVGFYKSIPKNQSKRLLPYLYVYLNRIKKWANKSSSNESKEVMRRLWSTSTRSITGWWPNWLSPTANGGRGFCISGCLIVFWQKARSGKYEWWRQKSAHTSTAYARTYGEKGTGQKKRLSNEEKDSPVSMDMETPEGKRSLPNLRKLGKRAVKCWCTIILDEMSMQEIADKLGFANTDTKTKKYKLNKNWMNW